MKRAAAAADSSRGTNEERSARPSPVTAGLTPTAYWATVAILAVSTLLLRVWQLDGTPPYLWWDEASQGLDARELLHGHLRIFYPRALGKEPLYVYLTAPFVALLDGAPAATRMAGAVTGALTTVTLAVCGPALWRERPALGRWAGLFAAALWTVNFWPQSINRIGFQVNTFPLVLSLAVAAWMSWTHRPTRGRALFFGAVAGMTLYTYLAARITPILWLALYVALAGRTRRSLARSLPFALGAFAATAAPLALHFILNPAQWNTRIATVGGEQAGGVSGWFMESARIAALFLGRDGDPLLRHNIPHQSPFGWWLVAMFVAGMIAIAVALVRYRRAGGVQWAWTLLLWLGILCLPALLAAEDNPHFTRLFGALPPALLIAAFVPALLLTRVVSDAVRQRRAGALLTLAMLLAGGASTIHGYFNVWRHTPDLYIWYQGDYWDLGRHAESHGETTLAVPVLTEPYVFDYAFDHAPILPLRPADPALEELLARNVPGPYLDIALWDTGKEAQADPRNVATFYAQREGSEAGETGLRRNTITRYRLSGRPQFDAEGTAIALDQQFAQGVTLKSARMGAAAPNPDRSSTALQPGTALWLILEWELDSPLPTVRVATKLLDASGHQLAPSDEWLFPENEMQWKPGTVVRTYHLLTVPPTAAPGTVDVTVDLYEEPSLAPLMPVDRDSPRVTIGTATVLPGSAESFVPEGSAVVQAQVADGVIWVGHQPLPAAHAAGLTLNTLLYFAFDGTASPATELTLTLQRAGAADDVPQTTGAISLPLPLDATPGRPFQVAVDVPVAPELESGAYVLQIGSPAGQVVSTSEPFAVHGRAHLFDRPDVIYPSPLRADGVAALVGINTGSPIRAQPGDQVAIQLVWRALATQQTEWVRFVHLLDDTGALVAQADGIPCDGDCRARTWLTGEYLVDSVALTLPEGSADGEYRLVAGWYDPASLARVPVRSPSGPVEAGDVMPLPLVIQVAAE